MSRALTPLETLAVAKLLTDKAEKDARPLIAPGVYDVVVDLHAEVTLKVGEDFDQRVVAKADPWTLLAAALSHLNGVTVASLVREAEEADPALVNSIKREAEEGIAQIKEATWTRMNGKVTVPRRIVEATSPLAGDILVESPKAPVAPGFDID